MLVGILYWQKPEASHLTRLLWVSGSFHQPSRAYSCRLQFESLVSFLIRTMWNPANTQSGQVTARMETTPSMGSASISVSQQQVPKKFAPVVAPKPKFNPYKQGAHFDPAGKHNIFTDRSKWVEVGVYKYFFKLFFKLKCYLSLKNLNISVDFFYR